MKRFYLSLLPIALMAALCTTGLSSCSDDDNDNGSEVATTSPIVGTWVESTELSSTSKRVITFTFKSNGTGTRVERAVVDGGSATLDPMNFSYTYNKSTEVIRLTFDNDNILYNGTASITGNTLILRYDNTYYNLTKQ